MAEQAELGGREGDTVPGDLKDGDCIVGPSPRMEGGSFLQGTLHTEDEDDSPLSTCGSPDWNVL